MKTYVPRGSVLATKLTVDNIEDVEKLCRGQIKGTQLPIEERVIDFYAPEQDMEYRIEMGEWYVVFESDLGMIRMSISDRSFQMMFKEEST